VFVRTAAPLVGLTRGAVTQVVYAACDRAGIPRASAHRLRHTLATDLLRSGSSLTEIGQVLRHRSISTTAIYANPRELHQMGEPNAFLRQLAA